MTALALTLTTKPDKQTVREVMQQHRETRTIPTPAEIRRQLGWRLEPNNKPADCSR